MAACACQAGVVEGEPAPSALVADDPVAPGVAVPTVAEFRAERVGARIRRRNLFEALWRALPPGVRQGEPQRVPPDSRWLRRLKRHQRGRRLWFERRCRNELGGEKPSVSGDPVRALRRWRSARRAWVRAWPQKGPLGPPPVLNLDPPVPSLDTGWATDIALGIDNVKSQRCTEESDADCTEVVDQFGRLDQVLDDLQRLGVSVIRQLQWHDIQWPKLARAAQADGVALPSGDCSDPALPVDRDLMAEAVQSATNRRTLRRLMQESWSRGIRPRLMFLSAAAPTP